MNQLLFVHADRERFVYVPADGVGGASGGVAHDGIPGLKGLVAIQFKWLRENIHEGANASEIRTTITRVSRSSRKGKRVKHLIIVTPCDLSPSESGWLHNLKRRPGLTIHHWGHAKIEQLLRQCPVLLARYYPHAALPLLEGFDGSDFFKLAQNYRQQVAIAHGRLKTIGLPPETVRERDSRADLRLRDLFIPLRLIPERAGAAPEDLARVLAAGGSAVVLGDPGMGKSTLLAYLALLFAGGASLEGYTPPQNKIPLFVSLRDLVRTQKTQDDPSLLAYIEARARDRLQLPQAHRAFFEAALRMGEAVMLLDGLDEVGGEAARHRIATAIRTFRAQFPSCPFWITSRIYGYTSSIRLSGDGYAHYRIGRLDDAQVNGFIDRWYGIQIPDDPADRATRATSLQEAVHRTPSVRRLAHNPLLLTLMAFIHHGLRKLPQDRGELYEKCVEMLLKTWQEARRDDPTAPHALGDLKLHIQTQKDYLAHLALLVQERNHGGNDENARGLFSRNDALDCVGARHWDRAVRDRPNLSKLEAREEMERFLEYVGDETGLLIDRGSDQLSFIHLSFQEYLAAWVFTCGTDTPGGPPFFEQHLGEPAWEEVLLLRLYIVLRAPGGGGTDEFDRIVARLLRRLEEKSSAQGWLTLIRALRDDLEFTDHNRKIILTRALEFWLDAPSFEGTWFVALEEVLLFAERARPALRGVLAEARAREPAARALACLHLEARLFGFPKDATDALRRRADLRDMLPDLVAFLGEPEIDGLLAERASVAHWSKALRGLDGPELHRSTLRWAFMPPAKAAAEAALGQLWAKILTELRLRSTIVISRQARDRVMLFGGLERLFNGDTVVIPEGRDELVDFDTVWSEIGATALSSVTHLMPADRSLLKHLPGEKARRDAKLLCDQFARERLTKAEEGDSRPELVAWATKFVSAQLELSQAAEVIDSDAVRSYIGHFASEFKHFFNFSVHRSKHRLVNLRRLYTPAFRFNDVAYRFGIDPDSLDVEAFRFPESDRRNRLSRQVEFWLYGNLLLSYGFDPKTAAREMSAKLGSSAGLCMFFIMKVWSAAALHRAVTMSRNLFIQHADGEVPNGTVRAWLKSNPYEVYPIAFTWAEHAVAFDAAAKVLAGAEGALFLAHAAYATLMTGFECHEPVWENLLKRRDANDVLVRISYALYNICRFSYIEKNLSALERDVQSPVAELQPIFEAAGLVLDSESCEVNSMSAQPTPGSPQPQKHDMNPVFTWLHLSDIHIGHKDASHQWDQALVLDVLRRDIAEQISGDIPAPSAILVTGDIAFSGTAEQYMKAKDWLLELAAQIKLSSDRIFLVPGNHDVDRSVDGTNRSAARLLRGLRDGSDDIDDAIANPADRAILTLRIQPYLSFAAEFTNLGLPDPFFWSCALTGREGFRLRLIGLNTALLAADNLDKGKLRLGKAALACTLTGVPEGEFVVVLSHHPFREGWLADQREADGWVKGRAHVHLSGHVHEADSEEARSGAGTSLLRVAAGAVHGDKLPPGVPASHGYSFSAVVPGEDGTLRLRVWPRKWSEKRKCFTTDTDNTPSDRPYAEHPLPAIHHVGHRR